MSLIRTNEKLPVLGFLEVDRSDYVGCPPHSPRIHRKVAMFENADQITDEA